MVKFEFKLFNRWIDVRLSDYWSFGSDVRFNNGNPYRDIRIGPIFIRIFWR